MRSVSSDPVYRYSLNHDPVRRGVAGLSQRRFEKKCLALTLASADLHS